MGLVDRKQREFERREEDILDAALALFAQPDWDSVTIEQIAKTAEIGKGTVYKHFASKDELLFRLMMRFYQGLLGHLQSFFISNTPAPEIFRQVIDKSLRYYLEHKEYRYIVEHCNGIGFKETADESWRESFGQLDKVFDEWAVPLLEKAMDEGRIERRPMIEFNIGMNTCFAGTVSMLWAGRDWCIEEEKEVIIQSATSFILAGLIGQPEKN